MSWKKVSGVLCNRKLSIRVKGKMYKSVVRPAMLYGMETGGSDRKICEKNGSCRDDNDEIGTGSDKKEQETNIGRHCKNRKAGRQTSECEATLVWARERREEGYVGKRMMEMVVPGRRKRGRPRRRWMDLAREDIKRVGAKEGDEVNREKWKILSCCGDPE